MPAKLKAALKGLGYAAFFLVALLAFVYLTLPLDALEDYLVRKVSDEYGADLEITELSMWGLSGLEMEGVTLTPRPTPEEIAEIRAAREARAAWQARQQAAAAEGAEDDEAPAGAAPAAAPGKPGATPAGSDKPTDGPAKPGDSASGKAAPGKRAPGTRADDTAQAKPKDQPPPIPPGPQPLYVESLRAEVALGKLIGDLMDGRIFNEEGEAALEAALLGGKLEARVTRTPGQMDVDATFDGLDLGQLTVLRTLLPLPIVGQFEGEVDLEVPLDEDGRFRLGSTTGFITLNLSNAVLGPGQIEAEALKNFGGFFDVPRLTLASFGGRINFEQRRAEFENFAFRGKDLEGDLTGSVQLANNLERFNPRAYLRFKFSEEFLERESAIGTLMRTVPEIRRGTGGDGFTGFGITLNTRKGSLAWRPTPRNPYGPRTSVRDRAAPPRPTVRGGRDALRDRTGGRTRLPSKRPTRPPVRRPSAFDRKPTPTEDEPPIEDETTKEVEPALEPEAAAEDTVVEDGAEGEEGEEGEEGAGKPEDEEVEETE